MISNQKQDALIPITSLITDGDAAIASQPTDPLKIGLFAQILAISKGPDALQMDVF